MKISATYLIAAQFAALGLGYVLRAPELQATAERQTTIRNELTESAFEHQEALSRAQTCIPLMSEMPITDGTAAYFSSVEGGRIVIHKNRPMPSGTTVCDAFGITGVVTLDAEGTPFVTNLRRMPPEQMQQILTSRGVMPTQAIHPFANIPNSPKSPK
ncbi:MAG: hypothetical protein KME25_30675 [Symplocastrum torsivum CPER-KK1]|jgi:hypothetical protein|uniref:Uncharacterized protein n=1 Tax=Symplocastrum torsivum CPER-KK1 TaxID=450513 RepID=A0A951PRS6_9CYAN|nr:hypothetical protein [Symplocastrum torsivum CPER-KK1]